MVTVSNSMKVIFKYISAIAASTKPVLITGESGVGKELIARAIHNASNRRGKFVAVNVAGLDNVTFSDTLFGHRKGAYTGADIERRGLIEEAADGTLFLDEIGSLDNCSQIKLLRLFQENEYYPLGSDICKTARTTIIAATNENLYIRMKENLFRKDLFYRLLTHHIEVPPLRTRKEDLTVLVDHFLIQASKSLDKKKPEIPPGLLDLLGTYDFPGNIRELESLMFDSVGRCQSRQLDISLFEQYIAKQNGVSTNSFEADTCNQYHIPYFGKFPKLREVEDFLIEDAIQKAGGSQYGAAELLGCAQSTLWRKVKKKIS
jgi:two-component system, NtrC family, response regulator HydG